MPQLVIIDRDGVINENREQGVLRPQQLKPLPGSLEAIARLNHAGIRVAVISGRPDTPEGQIPIESMDSIHTHLQQLLARRGGHIDAFFIATDTVEEDTEANLDAICDRFSTTPQQAVVITTNPHLLENPKATGIQAILVGTPSDNPVDDVHPHRSPDLVSATDYLLTS